MLTIATLIMSITATLLDPYLHLWDEAFHAVVAKNMLNHPLKPTLYEFHAVELGTPNWSGDHIWLHKQPLFLWQIALSFWVFGIEEWAIRFPSALLYTLMIPMAYRCGKLLKNESLAYFSAALLFATSYCYQLISGAYLVDHNDISFLFYVSASIWALLEFTENEKPKWLILVGVFCGLAILVKWLTGFLAIGALGLWLILEKKAPFKYFTRFLLAFLVACIVFVPWQVYAAINYPDVFWRELNLNSRHFWEVVEGHSEPWYFYFKNLWNVYGALLMFFFLIPVHFLANRKGIIKPSIIVLGAVVLVIYAFFSMASTKMPSFTLIATLPLYLLAGLSLTFLYEKISSKTGKIFMLFAFLAMVLAGLNFENLQRYHTLWKKPQADWRWADMHKKVIFTQYQQDHPDPTVAFNLKDFDSVYLLFYSNSIGYRFLPSEEDLERIIADYPVVVFRIGDEVLPDYIENHPEVEIRTDLYP